MVFPKDTACISSAGDSGNTESPQAMDTRSPSAPNASPAEKPTASDAQTLLSKESPTSHTDTEKKPLQSEQAKRSDPPTDNQSCIPIAMRPRLSGDCSNLIQTISGCRKDSPRDSLDGKTEGLPMSKVHVQVDGDVPTSCELSQADRDKGAQNDSETNSGVNANAEVISNRSQPDQPVARISPTDTKTDPSGITAEAPRALCKHSNGNSPNCQLAHQPEREKSSATPPRSPNFADVRRLACKDQESSSKDQESSSKNHKSASKDHKSASKDHKSVFKDQKSRSKDQESSSKDQGPTSGQADLKQQGSDIKHLESDPKDQASEPKGSSNPDDDICARPQQETKATKLPTVLANATIAEGFSVDSTPHEALPSPRSAVVSAVTQGDSAAPKPDAALPISSASQDEILPNDTSGSMPEASSLRRSARIRNAPRSKILPPRKTSRTLEAYHCRSRLDKNKVIKNRNCAAASAATPVDLHPLVAFNDQRRNKDSGADGNNEASAFEDEVKPVECSLLRRPTRVHTSVGDIEDWGRGGVAEQLVRSKYAAYFAAEREKIALLRQNTSPETVGAHENRQRKIALCVPESFIPHKKRIGTLNECGMFWL